MNRQTDLSKEQRLRYSRNLLLPEIGKEGQQRLLASRVLVVGAGALGSIVAMYLAASGVGHITLADYDTVDISNLQRQLSFSTADCGSMKVDAARRRIADINPDVKVDVFAKMITGDNAHDLFAGHDLVVEGSDNPATKYLVTDLCAELGIPCVLGGVSQFQGQVMSWAPGYPAYRDLFPERAEDGGYTPCSLGGVLGPLPGVIASTQACEAIKILTGAGTPLYGKLFMVDMLNPSATLLDL